MGKVTIRNRNAGKFDKNGKRKPPNWEYRFETAPVDGRRRQKTKAGFRTQQEAYDAGNAAYARYNASGRLFEPKDMSVSDYLDYWLEHTVKANIGQGYAYNTWLDYERKIRIHLKPAFGRYRLSALQHSPDVIQHWIDQLKMSGLSRNMVSNTLSCLSAALGYAVIPLQYISVNPCLLVRIGRMPVDRKSQAHREYVCPPEEFSRILQRFPPGSSFYLPLMAGYHLGTRIGETYGIDLLSDPDRAKLAGTFRKALKEELLTRKKQMMEYGPYYTKTYLLPDHSILQCRADIPVPHQEIWPLSVKENGELLTPETFKYCARVIHHELGNPMFHSHCLRHTHGTMLAEQGVNPKTIMERLGHKDIKTTLQVYTFNTDTMQQAAVDAFESVIRQ